MINTTSCDKCGFYVLCAEHAPIGTSLAVYLLSILGGDLYFSSVSLVPLAAQFLGLAPVDLGFTEAELEQLIDDYDNGFVDRDVEAYLAQKI